MKPRRPRGPIDDYNPHESTRALLADVLAILEEARDGGVLPLSVRSIYYRLLGRGHVKSKGLAARVSEHVSNARRAGLISWWDVYDSGETWRVPAGWVSGSEWLDRVTETAAELRLDRQAGQPRRLLIWSEAAGLVPLLARAGDRFGVPVLSTSGFDSSTVRHSVAVQAVEPLSILHVGDLDPHGLMIFEAMRADVIAWAEHYGNDVDVARLAVTPGQVAELGLPDDPDKPGAVQAEAIPPATMRAIIVDAIEHRQDERVRAELLDLEAETRAALTAALSGVAIE